MMRLKNFRVALVFALALGACTTTGDGDPTPESPTPETPTPDAGTPESPEAGTPVSPEAGTPETPAPDAGTPSPDPSPGVDAGPVPDDCGDDDPLTQKNWVGFCADRVDDNCTVDVPATPCGNAVGSHNYCATADEACPATQPGSAPPAWDCTGTPPANVIAFARLETGNAQVATFCSFVYESTAFPGEHYATINVVDGIDPQGPVPPAGGSKYCQADYSARRHFFYSDLLDATGAPKACDGVRYIHAYPQQNPTGMSYPVDDQKLSNTCRKMIRNVVRSPQAEFDPDIQYFAASREEALGKLAILDTAEVACVGIDNLQGQPYQPSEEWYSQASALIVMTGN